MTVTEDGREICDNEEEWQARRIEVWKRDGGRCQCQKSCPHHPVRRCARFVAPTMRTSIETNNPVAHIHHIKQRSAGRDDRMENLQILCGWCHQEAK